MATRIKLIKLKQRLHNKKKSKRAQSQYNQLRINNNMQNQMSKKLNQLQFQLHREKLQCHLHDYLISIKVKIIFN